MLKNLPIIVLLLITISCNSKKTLVKKSLELTSLEVKYLQNDKQVLDSVYSSLKLVGINRIKFHTQKYINKEYDKRKLFDALEMSKYLGVNEFEYNDSIPKESPHFNTSEELIKYLDSIERNLRKNINKDSIKK